MDPYFPSWLSLYYNPSTVKERTRAIKRLVRVHTLSRDVFQSDDTLFRFIADLCYFCSTHFQRAVGLKPREDGNQTERYKPGTIASYAIAIRDYQQFLRPNGRFTHSTDFVKRIGKGARHTEQSSYLISLVVPGYWISLFHQCVQELEVMQAHVDSYMVTGLSQADRQITRKTLKKIRAFLQVAYMLYHRPVLHTDTFVYMVRESKEPAMTEQELHRYLEDPNNLAEFFCTPTLDTTCTRLYVTAEQKYVTCHVVKANDKREEMFSAITYTMLPTLGFYFVLFGTILDHNHTLANSTPTERGYLQRPFVKSHRMADLWRMVITQPGLQEALHLDVDNAHRFEQRLKTMFLVVHTNFNMLQSSIESLEQTNRLQYIGHLSELGFVTSSDRSEYYKGMSRIDEVTRAGNIWSAMHLMIHPTTRNTSNGRTYGVKPLTIQNTCLQNLFSTWKNPPKTKPHDIEKESDSFQYISSKISRMLTRK
jgi:hypothetical protein